MELKEDLNNSSYRKMTITHKIMKQNIFLTPYTKQNQNRLNAKIFI